VGAIATNARVLDLDNDGVSDVEASGGGMGQGYIEEAWQIYSFNGWEPVFRWKLGPMLVSNAGAGCGMSEYPDPCEESEIKVDYNDIDGDGKTDLIETIRRTTWKYNAKKEKTNAKTETSVTEYLFREGKLVKRK